MRGGEVWVDTHSKVIRHYLSTWFPLDSSTIVIPAIFDFCKQECAMRWCHEAVMRPVTLALP